MRLAAAILAGSYAELYRNKVGLRGKPYSTEGKSKREGGYTHTFTRAHAHTRTCIHTHKVDPPRASKGERNI